MLYETVERLSVPSINSSSCGFVCLQIAGAQQRWRRSSKCGCCHVDNWGMRLISDLLSLCRYSRLGVRTDWVYVQIVLLCLLQYLKLKAGTFAMVWCVCFGVRTVGMWQCPFIIIVSCIVAMCHWFTAAASDAYGCTKYSTCIRFSSQ